MLDFGRLLLEAADARGIFVPKTIILPMLLGSLRFVGRPGLAANTLSRAGSARRGRSGVGNFTRNMETASGAQAITGIGYRSSLLFFLAVNSSGSDDEASFGYSNVTTDECICTPTDTTAGPWTQTTAACVNIIKSSVNNYKGQISSVENDGFTMTWTRGGSPTGTLIALYMVVG